MAGVPPHPSTVQDAATGGYGVHPQQAAQPGVQSLNQSAEFFLSNYRLGKTLGIGSFGKVGMQRSSRSVQGQVLESVQQQPQQQ
jgi:hypothetical protein